MSQDSSDLKLFRFVVLESFIGRSGKVKLKIPKGYVFSAKPRSYVVEFREVMDLVVESDGRAFKEPSVLLGLPCSFIGFYEE